MGWLVWELRQIAASIGCPVVGSVSGVGVGGGTVFTVAFGPRGHILATGSGDDTVRLWNVTDLTLPKLLSVLEGHANVVSAVAFSPDRHTVVTAAADGTARLWNTDTAQDAQHICTTAGAPITPDEWSQYFQNAPYKQPCATSPG